jgi:DNA-binding NarL/FixJ family response regulator
MPVIQVVLVDDHQIILDGLRALLDKDPGFDVMATFAQPQAALKFLATNRPDILVSDYSMKEMTGLELIRKAREIHPTLKATLLSMHDEPTVAKEALKQGVNGFLLKNIQQTELKEALRKINNGIMYVSPEITSQILQQSGLTASDNELSTRELQILKLITKEFSNKQIADQLNISERTVETHRKNIFRKTGSASLVGLVKYAFANKLVE